MGRDLIPIEEDVVFDLASRGLNQKEMAIELGVSVPTLAHRIADIQRKQGLILKYRDLQNIQLTSIQARILEAITPDKIAGASLSELVQAFRILKDKELVSLGKPNEITGIVGYLVQLEIEEASKNDPINITPEYEEELEELNKDISNADYTPCL